jgi:hypothetical protein
VASETDVIVMIMRLRLGDTASAFQNVQSVAALLTIWKWLGSYPRVLTGVAPFRILQACSLNLGDCPGFPKFDRVFLMFLSSCWAKDGPRFVRTPV